MASSAIEQTKKLMNEILKWFQPGLKTRKKVPGRHGDDKALPEINIY